MKTDLLKAVARSLLRTANRRLKDYAKSGVKNPNIESLLTYINDAPFFDSEKGKLTTGGLSNRELSDLIEVEKELRMTETARQYKKNVEKIYKKTGIKSKDPNLLYRAVERFKAIHGGYYGEWLDSVIEKRDIKSRGDTLAVWFKDILEEESRNEYSEKELEDIFSDSGFKNF